MENNKLLLERENTIKLYGDKIIEEFEKRVIATGLDYCKFDFGIDNFHNWIKPNDSYILSGRSRYDIVKNIRTYIKSKGFDCYISVLHREYGDYNEITLSVYLKHRSIWNKLSDILLRLCQRI